MYINEDRRNQINSFLKLTEEYISPLHTMGYIFELYEVLDLYNLKYKKLNKEDCSDLQNYSLLLIDLGKDYINKLNKLIDEETQKYFKFEVNSSSIVNSKCSIIVEIRIDKEKFKVEFY